MSTTSRSFSRQTQYLLAFLTFCCSAVAAIGSYPSNTLFITLLGMLAAIIGFVAVVQAIYVTKDPPSPTDGDEEIALRDLNTPVLSAEVTNPVNKTIQQGAASDVRLDDIQMNEWRLADLHCVSDTDDESIHQHGIDSGDHSTLNPLSPEADVQVTAIELGGIDSILRRRPRISG
ncbi:uncharacterized protein BT62DRAFT_994421 [Guyanagaster necrorhizus]|uniref:Uncharacterized protein n=1 Tax=Guyanagaster necrorhizus TaxID=856835 RepID=A0A9P8AS97_9AGAR|nr:uncharacterized protein BT62DRAFT_994421 [Guyanagaster necrorhizus MCA 3950]KAG7446074.1 hypothetical protein BT62DRAFT_994421 [Guyanagaster necrorhizus MCA 3950]